ncbi:MAG: sugar O-acetyltransferase [Lachnospiraceae bacterium]|nr:sugar O-acetyltransferase [Lachnospiraceae bacterium]
MTQKERMEAGLVYDAADGEIEKEQTKCLELLYEYNATRPTEQEKRKNLLKKMFGSIGEGCYIEPPFRANWGGKNCFFEELVYANFNLTLVDDGNIYVGAKTMFGPNVCVATANHPINVELREKMLQYNKDVHIGRCVWIGANTVIVPGVTIGDNSVIGAGSVVTKDIPENVVAYGNPCRVVREIGERDREFFYKDEKIDWECLKNLEPAFGHAK